VNRSGYSDDYDNDWSLIMWRGAVASAFRGRRGQAFLCEMLAALDVLPDKRLIAKELEADGQVCALGAVGKTRGLSMSEIDPADHKAVADKFDIAHAMACEIMYENDEGGGYWRSETPEQRFERMRRWVAAELKPPK
jgi:hypothetical protein